jgi:sec-independent protein translocase protein TatB
MGNFLGIGPAELLVILVLALLVVGPNRLPEMAAQLARFLRAFRRYSANVTREFNETMRELEHEYDDMRGEWKDVGQGLDETARTVNKELDSASRETRQALNDAKAESSKPISSPP